MTDSEDGNAGNTAWRRPVGVPQVVVPNMCERHQLDVCRRLRMSEKDPWRVALTIVQILLFTWTTADTSFHRRTEGDPENMSLILAELGCLACTQHDGFIRAIALIRNRGLTHAAAVSRMEIADELWPIQARIDAMDAIRPGGGHGEAQKD